MKLVSLWRPSSATSPREETLELVARGDLLVLDALSRAASRTIESRSASKRNGAGGADAISSCKDVRSCALV